MRINQIRQFDRGNYYYGVQEEYYDRQDEEDEGITLNLINM
jgi:Asp-tRNA(Asn)/Glu-tRNA(Gln) amidotransferase B subunit